MKTKQINKIKKKNFLLRYKSIHVKTNKKLKWSRYIFNNYILVKNSNIDYSIKFILDNKNCKYEPIKYHKHEIYKTIKEHDIDYLINSNEKYFLEKNK